MPKVPMKKTVYLCGGINALSDAQAKDWRKEAEASLSAAGLATLDPMARDYRGKETQAVKEIVEGDLLDIAQCGIILVNASRPSWGTAMEVMYSARCVERKKIYAFGAGDRPSPWLVYHCDGLFPDVAAAIARIISGK